MHVGVVREASSEQQRSRKLSDLSVRFADVEDSAIRGSSKPHEDFAIPDRSKPTQACRVRTSAALDYPEQIRESPPSSLIMPTGKTCCNSDGHTGKTEQLRLLTNLLQMVVQELCEQMKDGPIHQQGRLAIQEYAQYLKSIAENEFPICVSTAFPEHPGISTLHKQSEHAVEPLRMDAWWKEAIGETNYVTEPLTPTSPSGGIAVTNVFSGASPVSASASDVTKTRSVSGTSPWPLERTISIQRTSSCTSQWTKALVNVFHELDVDGDGTLSRDELRAALQAVGVPAARVQKILNAADVDGSGEIDLSEWKTAVAKGGDDEMRRVSAHLMRMSASGTSILNASDRAQSPRCMLRPDSPLRLLWDVALTLLCIYVALVLPFTNGFDEWITHDVVESLLQFELIVDLVFLLDVCLNFRTGIMEKDGTLILDWRRVAYRYFSTWFVLDIVSSVPFTEISAGRLASVRILKLLKIPKIIRALRVIKPILMAQSELVTVVDEVFSSPVLRAVSRRSIMFILTILLCHWLACLMAFCSKSWLIEYLSGKGCEPDLWRSYLAAVYWAMTTMTTVGYGDITPSTDLERGYTTIAMVIGGAYYGYAVGTIVSIVSNRDLNASRYHDRMDEIYAWLDHHRFPIEMRRRIIRYFKGYLTEKAAIDEADVVNELSPALRNEVGKLVLHEDIRNNPIFDNLPISAVTRLHKIVHKVYIEAGHTVVQEGEVGTAMFIVGNGMVRMEFPDVDGRKSPVKVLCTGDSFGEEILSGLEDSYSYTAIAIKKTVSLFMIEQEAFQQLFDHMQGVRDQVLKNVVALRNASSRPSLGV